MEMIAVDSSNVAAIGYDPENAVLRIQFKPANLYEYYDVPQFEYDGLMGAESKGQYGHQNIYKKYRQTKIG